VFVSIVRRWEIRLKDFEGRVAVITGGVSGIGLGIAQSLSTRGAKLVLGDLNEENLAREVARLSDQGASVIGQRCDVADLASVEALAEVTLSHFGKCIACNNGGVGIPTSATNMKLEDWRWIIDVDLWGPIYGVKVFLPLIEEAGEGHISATSSLAGLISGQMMGAYNVAKHGVVALMAATERELRDKKNNITASVLCPGAINTNISRNSVGYRPEKSKPKGDSAKAGKTARNIQASLEAGMQPEQVGELVVNAIESDKFWVLTHPQWTKALQKQLDAMMEDQTLTRA
jgi:NAD(P)-dependent dehydrogenase (short-subunit alcohol dehydrogenase family)